MEETPSPRMRSARKQRTPTPELISHKLQDITHVRQSSTSKPRLIEEVKVIEISSEDAVWLNDEIDKTDTFINVEDQ